MSRYRTALFAFAISASASAIPECGQVTGQRILGRDLAALVPLFETLPPEEPVGFAPLPGARRVFRSEELARLAARYGLKRVPMEPICFVVPAEALNPREVETAIRTSLELPVEATVEILDHSKQPVPPGKLEFARSASTDSRQISMLRGRVVYGERRSVPVWARARIRVKRKVVVATDTLPAGEPIAGSRLNVREIEGQPGGSDWLADVREAVGRIPRRPVPAGSPLQASLLSEPKDIERGDVVEVVVTSGAAKISVPAKATAGGKRGDQIVLTNPESGRKFSARIDGPGKASVTVLPRLAERDPMSRSGNK